jgi:hypothetical protein
MAMMTAQDLRDAGDRAACAGDYDTADAYRVLEGNARGGPVMRRWAGLHMVASEAEVHAEAHRLALGWGASEQALFGEAMSVFKGAL